MVKHDLNDSRFKIIIGDITQLYSKFGIVADCIVNTANSTLSDKGGGLNKSIHTAVGKELLTLTKENHPSRAKVGVTYPVTLPDSSTFYKQQKTKHVCYLNKKSRNDI